MKIVGLIIGGLIVVVLGIGLWFNQIVSAEPGESTKLHTLTITEGSGVKAVAEDLLKAGYINQRWHWNAYIFVSGLRSSILPGDYALKPEMSIRDIASLVTTLPSGPQEVEVKLLEGWTATDMADVLDRAGVLDRQTFLDAAAATDSRSVVDKQYGFFVDKPDTASLEGYLFPDTYRFFVDSTSAQVFQKLLDNFDRKLSASMRTDIAQQKRTIFEVVVLASILEKELETDTDRALAADLFLRRISIGMPLQSDATVNYVTKKSALQPTLDDTRVDSPYNTYQYLGLPPGPISNPSISSLRSAINPTPNAYLYFLTELSRKKTHFSTTLEEHNQNKAKYLR